MPHRDPLGGLPADFEKNALLAHPEENWQEDGHQVVPGARGPRLALWLAEVGGVGKGETASLYNVHTRQQQPGEKQPKQTLKGCFGLNPRVGSGLVR